MSQNMVDRDQYDMALKAIAELVDSGVAIDEIEDTRYSGRRPIWIRMLDDGREDAAKFAIMSGADVNGESTAGQTVLEMAAEHGFRDIVQLLLDRGADVDRGHYGSPLATAAKQGHGDIVDLLLASGANVNSVNTYGHTPLMGAGDVSIIKRLVAHGAQLDAKDNRGRGCMYYYAGQRDNAAALEYLSTVGAASPRPERFQAIVSFSRLPMSDWDASELHRGIESSQYEIGRMMDTAVFKAENITAGASVDDTQYLYAALRESLAGIGGHELISRCYLHDFAASNGNNGKYVVLLDRTIDAASAPGGRLLSMDTDSAADDRPTAEAADSPPLQDHVQRAAETVGTTRGKEVRRWWRRG